MRSQNYLKIAESHAELRIRMADESHGKSMTGGSDLDGTERRTDRVSRSVGCVEGLEGRGEIRRGRSKRGPEA